MRSRSRARRPRRPAPAARQRRRGGGQREDARQVHLRRDHLAHRAHPGQGIVDLAVGHQAQVAFDEFQPGVVLHRAEHRHVGVVLDHRAQLGLVARAAEAVEDHAADADVAVEGLVAQDQRRDAACHASRIEHQQHRQAELLGQRCVAVAAVQRQAVVQALVALDQAQARSGTVPREAGVDLGVRHQHRIEVHAGAAGGQRQPHRVDVVRPLLEGLHEVAAQRQGGGQAERHRRLARRLVRSGDEQPWRAHQLTPRPWRQAPRSRPEAGSPGPGCRSQ